VYAQYIVGTYITKVWESQKFEYAGKTKILKKLNEDLKGLDVKVIKSIWQLLLFLGIFYGFFIFDVIGDQVGYRGAVWAPISLLAIFVTMYFNPLCVQVYKCVKETTPDQGKDDTTVDVKQDFASVNPINSNFT
jgi:hypothetical protein